MPFAIVYIPPLEYACKTTCEIIFVASTYRSVHFAKHACSLELIDPDGFVTHNLKHRSRVVVKNSYTHARTDTPNTQRQYPRVWYPHARERAREYAEQRQVNVSAHSTTERDTRESRHRVAPARTRSPTPP